MTFTLNYDLSELFLTSGGKLKYYGISRVVAEVGYELSRIAPETRFVIFSPGDKKFYEVNPRFGDASPSGVIDPNVDVKATPIRIRETFHTKNMLRDLAQYPFAAVINAINRKRLKAGAAQISEVDMSGGALVAFGRPKIIAEYVRPLAKMNCDVALHPLVHDMMPLHYFKRRANLPFPRNFLNDNIHMINRSAQILTNSAFTRDDMIEWSQKGVLPELPPSVAVPLVHECRPGTEAPEKTLPDEPYLLCVGALVGRKNVEVVFNAMLHLHEAGKPVPRLVLAGAVRGHITKYLEQEKYDPIRERIEQSANPNQTDLVRYYEGAMALVIGSRMEGWGLPPGEALWLGTPAICADVPALREVGQDLALYFDPDDVAALAGHIERLRTDPDFVAALKASIRAAKSRLRTWRDVAQETNDAVQRFHARTQS